MVVPIEVTLCSPFTANTFVESQIAPDYHLSTRQEHSLWPSDFNLSFESWTHPIYSAEYESMAPKEELSIDSQQLLYPHLKFPHMDFKLYQDVCIQSENKHDNSNLKSPCRQASLNHGERRTPQSSSVGRPGRPSKAQAAASWNKRSNGRNKIIIRREMQKDSAMRSRKRFTNTLDQLWEIVSEDPRAPLIKGWTYNHDKMSRDLKVEITISLLKDLQSEVADSQTSNMKY